MLLVKHYQFYKMKLISIIVLVVLCSLCAKSQQYPTVTIPGTEVRKITSAIVKGQEYELQISLPAGYNAKKKYPVIYVMDSQWDFPLVKSIYGQQFFDGFIPEAIIVGVTWGGINPNPDSLRARDYTPTKEQRLVQSGGADLFLDFMKKELFQFIETNYYADNQNRTLMGCSLGGLFTLYTLFTHTDMFMGYAAASPAVGWDNGVLYKFEKEFAAHKTNKPISLYLTVGDVEKGSPLFEKMATFLKNNKYPNMRIRSRVLENTGHSGTKSETYNRGLQFIFEKPDLQTDISTLNKYVGIYENADGKKVELKTENNQLVLSYSPVNTFPLKFAGKNSFYSNAQFLNIVFMPDAKTLQLNGYGKTDAYSRR